MSVFAAELVAAARPLLYFARPLHPTLPPQSGEFVRNLALALSALVVVACDGSQLLVVDQPDPVVQAAEGRLISTPNAAPNRFIVVFKEPASVASAPSVASQA